LKKYGNNFVLVNLPLYKLESLPAAGRRIEG
jgi:hypothetical protein